METSDAELVGLARSGDRDALGALTERYQGRLLRVLVGMVRNPEDAKDIAQDAFVRAFSNLQGFKGQSSFYTWLYRIAVNLVIDQQRREGRRRNSEFDETVATDSPYVVDATGRDPFARVRDAELVRKVKDAIDELTPDHRAVILLREVDGLSYKEISDVVGCSMGTVMSRLHYARKKLHERLGRTL